MPPRNNGRCLCTQRMCGGEVEAINILSVSDDWRALFWLFLSVAIQSACRSREQTQATFAETSNAMNKQNQQFDGGSWGRIGDRNNSKHTRARGLKRVLMNRIQERLRQSGNSENQQTPSERVTRLAEKHTGEQKWIDSDYLLESNTTMQTDRKATVMNHSAVCCSEMLMWKASWAIVDGDKLLKSNAMRWAVHLVLLITMKPGSGSDALVWWNILWNGNSCGFRKFIKTFLLLLWVTRKDESLPELEANPFHRWLMSLEWMSRYFKTAHEQRWRFIVSGCSLRWSFS